MRKAKGQLTSDVEELVKQSVVEEAVSDVWSRLETALGQLEPESRDLLSAYLGGAKTEDLCSGTQFSKAEIETFIRKAKRQLINQLRQGVQLKQ